MLLNYGSMIVIALFAGYNLFFIARRNERMDEFARAFVGTFLSFTASMAFGFIFAQTFDYDLYLSMGFGILFAAVATATVGLLFKRKIGLNAALAGVLGALLGAAIGKMVFASDKPILIADTIYIVLMYLLLKFGEWKTNQETASDKPKKAASKKLSSQAKNKPGYAGAVALGVGVVVVALLITTQKDRILSAQIGLPQSKAATYDEQNDLQVATIEVTSAGLSPRNTQFKSGTMIKAIFHVPANSGEDWKLTSAELDVDNSLKPGDNIFLINNPNPGTYTFNLGPGKGQCTFTVVPAS
ncbi:hypothetical protein D7Z26_11455 [Cohnella endophytica]|uniref:Uncharacterized protein n=1 Tax=Cohnella endophytica TaxID=2419778 RepID=A0A494XY98_9BACL|nr:cupredoxin domain-containing protein [Cohnella endophytica]RKP53999.1 hypothetical protein D7Z26_11455 [Cohnella endophytica]